MQGEPLPGAGQSPADGVETQEGEQKVSSGHFLRGETLVRGFPGHLRVAEAPTEAVAENAGTLLFASFS